MRTWIFCTALALSAMLADPLNAAIMMDPLSGTDSGWIASWGESVVTVVPISVVGNTLTVTIYKNFGPAEAADGEEESHDALITFTHSATPPLSGYVTKIVVAGETIQNNSALAWTQFNWIILQPGTASFNVNESAWDAAPFTVNHWLDAVGEPVTGNSATRLTVSDGEVGAGSVFTPQGYLVIQPNQGITTFTLKEFPVPEPVSLCLLGVAAIGLLRARKIRRA
jgi:hypothetical protein